MLESGFKNKYRGPCCNSQHNQIVKKCDYKNPQQLKSDISRSLTY